MHVPHGDRMIAIDHVSKQFAYGAYVLRDTTLHIPSGESTCIIGQSGQGKSILLKMIIGLLEPTHGSVTIDGVSTSGNPDMFATCGYVFQFAALLDSLTVFENIALSLLEHGYTEDAALPIVHHALYLVNLTPDILNKYPDQLSGGMKKRVGLARTLVTQPSIILYDEPTTGLDPITTQIVHQLIYRTQQEMGITSVVVSHNTDIFRFVDNIALLHDGKIQFFGSALEARTTENPYMQQFLHADPNGPMRNE